ncbi:hypothetical protein [Dongshaea marina]|uniref:hypothetical protein n=1 Tax=Dongshaea marina TaxID=2047966 RepID=UPI000D3E871B|nr:hypothetical protein [Dongshaea marina]
MQYAFMELYEDSDECCLMDAGELDLLRIDIEELDEQVPNEDTMALKLLYGCYKPQSGYEDPGEIKQDMTRAVNRWLAHFSGDSIQYFGIKAIEPLDVRLMKPCADGQSSHASRDIPFSALVKVPNGVALPSGKRALSAFIRLVDCDVVTNLLVRPGLFAFGAEERRYSTPVTEENWRERIDYQRALRVAQKIM